MTPALEYLRTLAPAAGPLGLVILLYDTLLRDCGRAREAAMAGEVEKRSAEVGHALLVLQELQGRLDPSAGEPARQLEQFYAAMRALLLEASLQDSPALFQQAIANVTSVRAAWSEAEQKLARDAPDASRPAQRSSPQLQEASEEASQWSA